MTNQQLSELQLLLSRAAEILKSAGSLTTVEDRHVSNLLTLTEAARLCHVNPAKLTRAVVNGEVPPARHKMAGKRRRLYHVDEVPTLQAHFAGVRQVTRAERRRADGYFSRLDVANMAGVQPISISHHEKAGRWGPPTHRWAGGGLREFFYVADEVEAILKIMESREGFLVRSNRGPSRK